METHEMEVRGRLEPALSGGGRHERAARAEAVRPSTTLILGWTTAAAALETMRSRFGAATTSDLGAPDFTALERVARDRAGERLEYVMLFGADHDAQVLLRPGCEHAVFCGSSPADREMQPAGDRINP